MRIPHPLQRSMHRSLALACLFCPLAATAGDQSPPRTGETPAAPELAVTMRADSPDLKWGPCPEFLPEGCAFAVLHGDPSKPNADVLLKVPGKARIASHWHTSAERMVLVAGELRATYRGQPSSTLRPGSYAYGPAKAVHEAECLSAEPCILFIAFEGPVDAIPEQATPERAPERP